MEVLLIKDYPRLGFIGEQFEVKNGYARNFLIPQGIAIWASSKNAKELQHRLAMVNARKAKKKAEATELKDKIEKETLEFKLKFAEEGKSFGSISSHDIVAALVAKGFDIERKQLVLTEAIKSVGDYEVSVKLHSEVVAKIAVKVIAEKILETKSAKDNARKPRHRKQAAEEAVETAENAEVTEEDTTAAEE